MRFEDISVGEGDAHADFAAVPFDAHQQAADIVASIAAVQARFGETWLAAQNRHVQDWMEMQAAERRRCAWLTRFQGRGS